MHWPIFFDSARIASVPFAPLCRLHTATMFLHTVAHWILFARVDTLTSIQPCGPVAQLGARFHGMEEVVGSIPTRSTNYSNKLAYSPKDERFVDSILQDSTAFSLIPPESLGLTDILYPRDCFCRVAISTVEAMPDGTGLRKASG